MESSRSKMQEEIKKKKSLFHHFVFTDVPNVNVQVLVRSVLPIADDCSYTLWAHSSNECIGGSDYWHYHLMLYASKKNGYYEKLKDELRKLPLPIKCLEYKVKCPVLEYGALSYEYGISLLECFGSIFEQINKVIVDSGMQFTTRPWIGAQPVWELEKLEPACARDRLLLNFENGPFGFFTERILWILASGTGHFHWRSQAYQIDLTCRETVAEETFGLAAENQLAGETKSV